MKLERSWVEIDKKALEHNARVFRKLSGKSLLMAVVKSNAYGHGIIESSKILNKNVDWFGVDDLDEALALRKAGIKKPILVLGYTIPSRYTEASRANVSVTVASLESLRELKMQSSKGKVTVQRAKLKIHIKLETGLNRQGITEELLAVSCQMIGGLKEKVILEGVYSHFAAAELAREKKYRDYCNKQMDKFERMAALVDPKHETLWHMGATAATILLPRSRYDLVRVGIGIYGLDPTSDVKLPLVRKVDLEPALRWYTTISQIKNVKKGEGIGYDLTEVAKWDMKVAILPIGYAYGYPRAASSKGVVLIKGKECKVLGRVSMCMTIIDVSKVVGAWAGDRVTLIGDSLLAEEVAARAGTINYELVTRINPLIKRTYK